jgi:hypothetical protein
MLGISVHAKGLGLNTETEVRIDAGSALNASSSAGPADSEDAARANSGVAASASFSLSRSDASVTNSSGTMVDAASVNTEGDLEAYAAATLRTSNTLKGVQVDSERVVLRFTEEAQLLGFIPHTMTSRVEVREDGSVRVMRPWYGFLATGASADASVQMEARVRQALADARAHDGPGLSAHQQAAILAEVAASLNGASMSATADASVESEAASDQP